MTIYVVMFEDRGRFWAGSQAFTTNAMAVCWAIENAMRSWHIEAVNLNGL